MSNKHAPTTATRSPKAVVEELVQLLQKDLKAREKSTPWLRENWFNLIQVAILLLGGLWSLYIFRRFDSFERATAIKLSEIASKKSQIELEELQARSIEYQGGADPVIVKTNTDTDEGIFDVVYYYNIRNGSSTPITVTSIIVQAFYHPPLQHGNERSIEVPDLTISDNTGWETLLIKGYVSQTARPANAELRTPDNVLIPDPAKDIWGDGILPSGNSLAKSAGVQVRSPNRGYIGFLVSVNYSERGKERQSHQMWTHVLGWDR